MKSYPSIAHYRKLIKSAPSIVSAFDKCDGSNIRAEWNPKRGFYKFGTRTQLLLPEDRVFGGIPALFEATLAEDLHRIFKAQRWKRAIAFMEFWGEGSFAGTHDLTTPKTLSLIDVSYDTRGFLEPEPYLDLFGDLSIAPRVYRGPLTEEFIESVRTHTCPGITLEGVVVKGPYTSPGLPWMAKIKTQAWYDALKAHCGENLALYEKLK